MPIEKFVHRRKPKVYKQNAKEGDEGVEITAAAMNFLHKFHKLPLDKMSKEEIEQTVLPLLKEWTVIEPAF
jgi:hypothetical protein